MKCEICNTGEVQGGELFLCGPCEASYRRSGARGDGWREMVWAAKRARRCAREEAEAEIIIARGRADRLRPLVAACREVAELPPMVRARFREVCESSAVLTNLVEMAIRVGEGGEP